MRQIPAEVAGLGWFKMGAYIEHRLLSKSLAFVNVGVQEVVYLSDISAVMVIAC